MSQPSEKLPPGRPKPVCSKQKLPAAYQWQQFRIRSSDQGDFNSTNYLLNQMDLVWKYPKHLHFPGLSYRDKVSKLQEDSKTNPPRKQRFQSEAQQLFLSFDFHKYRFGVSKKVTKSSNSRVCSLQASQPSPCPPDNMRKPASLPGSIALNALLCPSTLCICSQQGCEHTHNPRGWDLYGALHCHFLDLHNRVVHHRDAETTAQTALAAGGKFKILFLYISISTHLQVLQPEVRQRKANAVGSEA